MAMQGAVAVGEPWQPALFATGLPAAATARYTPAAYLSSATQVPTLRSPSTSASSGFMFEGQQHHHHQYQQQQQQQHVQPQSQPQQRYGYTRPQREYLQPYAHQQQQQQPHPQPQQQQQLQHQQQHTQTVQQSHTQFLAPFQQSQQQHHHHNLQSSHHHHHHHHLHHSHSHNHNHGHNHSHHGSAGSSPQTRRVSLSPTHTSPAATFRAQALSFVPGDNASTSSKTRSPTLAGSNSISSCTNSGRKTAAVASASFATGGNNSNSNGESGSSHSRKASPALSPSLNLNSATGSPRAGSPAHPKKSAASSRTAREEEDSDSDEGVASGAASDQGDSDSCETGDQLLHSYLYHRYVHVRDRALAERASLGLGKSPLMRSLYNFWVERLQHKFNRNMFANFKELAMEDAQQGGDRYGMECLFIFLRRSLSTIYRERLFREFIALVTEEFQEETFGLEMLSLFLDERSPEIAVESHATVQKRIYSNPELAAALRMLGSLRRLCLE